jgi:hypothetical protein
LSHLALVRYFNSGEHGDTSTTSCGGNAELSVSHSDSETGAPVPNPVSAARPTLLMLSIMFDSAVMLNTRASTVSSILNEHKIGTTYECFVLTNTVREEKRIFQRNAELHGMSERRGGRTFIVRMETTART